MSIHDYFKDRLNSPEFSDLDRLAITLFKLGITDARPIKILGNVQYIDREAFKSLGRMLRWG